MKKILLCDDDLDIATLMSIIVKSLKYEFAKVNEIKEITDLIEQEKPDLILMDLWIPEIGGEEAVKLIKADSRTKDIPVLLFSANDQLPEIAEKVGADGFIRKPFDIAVFKDTIAPFLS